MATELLKKSFKVVKYDTIKNTELNKIRGGEELAKLVGVPHEVNSKTTATV